MLLIAGPSLRCHQRKDRKGGRFTWSEA